jgi:hypothetical protein
MVETKPSPGGPTSSWCCFLCVTVASAVKTSGLLPASSVPWNQKNKECVQALSGVLTLLTMSKTMLDLVLQLGGLKLVLELLVYEAHAADNDDDVAVRLP